MIAVFNSEDNNDDNDKRREKTTEIMKVNITWVIRQSEKRNTQL